MTADQSATATQDPPPDLAALGTAYAWGTVHTIDYIPTGLMNRNWRISTDAGAFALKQILDGSTTLALTRRNLRILSALAGDGIPCCPPRLTIDGNPVAEIEDRGYCLLPWREGTHPTGPDLSLTQAHDFGILVGRIHDSLNAAGLRAGLPELPDQMRMKVTEPAAALAEADRYLAAARAGGSDFDRTVVELLHRRKVLIDKFAATRPADDSPRGRFGWTHGDLQYRNVLWRDGRIVGVLDWDRIRVRFFGEEVTRTATVQFGLDHGGLDLERIAAFVAGYRSVIALTDADLMDAVNRLFWKRMSDFWQLDFHYDRGDCSCDALLTSGEAVLDWWTAHLGEVEAAFI